MIIATLAPKILNIWFLKKKKSKGWKSEELLEGFKNAPLITASLKGEFQILAREVFAWCFFFLVLIYCFIAIILASVLNDL